MVTAVINVLPIFPLDGGRVLLAVLSRNGQRTKAIKKVRLIGIILSSIILVGFVLTVFFTPNYTMLIFGSFLFVTSILYIYSPSSNAFFNSSTLLYVFPSVSFIVSSKSILL